MPLQRAHWLVLFVIAACVKSNAITVRTSAIDDRAPVDTGDAYDFDHVSVEGYVQQKPGFYAVHTNADWSSAWNEVPQGTHPPLPAAVDLKAKMLFVATSKTPEAKSIEVQKITRTFDGLKIYVLETLAAPSCPPEPKKAPPIDIVSLDNVQFDMHVVYDRVHAETCGPPPDAVVTCRIAGAGASGSDKITSVPGETIDCDSSQSHAQVGAIVDRNWQLNAIPNGSSTKLTAGKDNIGITFPVDAWGVYQVGLDIRDATRTGSGLGIVEVLPPDAGVQLYFTHIQPNADPATLPRAELHVVELPFNVGTSPNADCTPQSQKSWCEMHTTPALQQGLIKPEGTKRYRVAVKYLDARLPGAPVACVRSFAKGVPPVNTCDPDEGQRAKGAVWDLGALDPPHATFYDAKLSKPPAPPAIAADAGAPAPTTTTTSAPPLPTHTAPPPPTPSATGSAQIEL